MWADGAHYFDDVTCTAVSEKLNKYPMIVTEIISFIDGDRELIKFDGICLFILPLVTLHSLK